MQPCMSLHCLPGLQTGLVMVPLSDSTRHAHVVNKDIKQRAFQSFWHLFDWGDVGCAEAPLVQLLQVCQSPSSDVFDSCSSSYHFLLHSRICLILLFPAYLWLEVHYNTTFPPLACLIPSGGLYYTNLSLFMFSFLFKCSGSCNSILFSCMQVSFPFVCKYYMWFNQLAH